MFRGSDNADVLSEETKTMAIFTGVHSLGNVDIETPGYPSAQRTWWVQFVVVDVVVNNYVLHVVCL